MKSGPPAAALIKRGIVWSRRLVHNRVHAPDFETGATLPIRVQCRDASGGGLDPHLDLSFAIAVTLHIDAIPEYDVREAIRDQLLIRLRGGQRLEASFMSRCPLNHRLYRPHFLIQTPRSYSGPHLALRHAVRKLTGCKAKRRNSSIIEPTNTMPIVVKASARIWNPEFVPSLNVAGSGFLKPVYRLRWALCPNLPPSARLSPLPLPASPHYYQ